MKKFFALMTFLLMFAAQVSAMNLTIYESVGSVGVSSKPSELNIKDYTQLYGYYSKGVAVFDDALYFHFDCNLAQDNPNAAARFGSSDFSNTVPIYVFEGGTKIYPITDDDGHEFWLFGTETGGGGSFTLIGARNGDGKWVQYFNTLDMRKQIPREFYLEDFYVEGDTIIFLYKEWKTENYCELRYKWNPSLLLFNSEVRK